jgi:zinc transporter 7
MGAYSYSCLLQENEIEQCAPVKKLSTLKESLEAAHSPVMRTVFAWLFPFGPAWNSILGTFYISSYVPCYIIGFGTLMEVTWVP